jgi:hypothetical protein
MFKTRKSGYVLYIERYNYLLTGQLSHSKVRGREQCTVKKTGNPEEPDSYEESMGSRLPQCLH